MVLKYKYKKVMLYTISGYSTHLSIRLTPQQQNCHTPCMSPVELFSGSRANLFHLNVWIIIMGKHFHFRSIRRQIISPEMIVPVPVSIWQTCDLAVISLRIMTVPQHLWRASSRHLLFFVCFWSRFAHLAPKTH